MNVKFFGLAFTGFLTQSIQLQPENYFNLLNHNKLSKIRLQLPAVRALSKPTWNLNISLLKLKHTSLIDLPTLSKSAFQQCQLSYSFINAHILNATFISGSGFNPNASNEIWGKDDGVEIYIRGLSDKNEPETFVIRPS